MLASGRVPDDLQDAHRLFIAARNGLAVMTASEHDNLPLPLTIKLALISSAYAKPPKKPKR